MWPLRIEVTQSPHELTRFGLLVPGALVHPQSPPPRELPTTRLLIDTGSDGFVIDQGHAERLGLQLHRMQDAHGLHGGKSTKKYMAAFVLPAKGADGQWALQRMPIECAATPGFSEFYAAKGCGEVQGVIGRNMLQFCRLTIDGQAGKSSIEIFEEIMRPSPAG